jgi:hypothetical protein
VVLKVDNYPALGAPSFDMGWNQRSQMHNSHLTMLFLWEDLLAIQCKLCFVCTLWEKNKAKNRHNMPVPDHFCLKNYEGKSGGMEPEAASVMIKLLHKKFHVSLQLMDDDASTRQALRLNNADYLKNNNTTVLLKVKITVGKNKRKLQGEALREPIQSRLQKPIFVVSKHKNSDHDTFDEAPVAYNSFKNKLRLAIMIVFVGQYHCMLGFGLYA